MKDLISDINPVTRIIALITLTTPLLLSVDVVSAAIALGATLLLAPLAGVGPGQLCTRSLPLLLMALLAAVSMALYGRPEGQVHFRAPLIQVTDNSLALALAIGLRILAVGLPVVVLIARIDPTELGDGLARILRLPERFVLGAVAGARLITLFRADWRSLALARRARGVAERGRILHVASMSFSLLVLSLRRGSRLATAMEARGFGRHGPRTWARDSELKVRDLIVVLVCTLIATVSILVSVHTGHFRFLGT